MLRGGPLRFPSRGPRRLGAQPELAVAGRPSPRSGLQVISEPLRLPPPSSSPSVRPPSSRSRRHELQAVRVAARAGPAAVAAVAAPAGDGPGPAPGQRLLPARPGACQLLHRGEEDRRVQGGGGPAGSRPKGRSCGWGRVPERRRAGRASWAGGQCGQGPCPLRAALEGALSARATQATRPPRPRRVADTALVASRSPLDWSARSSRGDLPPAP